jgi:2-keto-4-pentenoate hydratase
VSVAQYSAETIADYIGGVLPALELVDTRYADWTRVGALQLAADNAIHGAWIHGAVRTDWRRFSFADQKVFVKVNGRILREGEGRNVLGDPLNVVAWLANQLPKRGQSLRAGDAVSTGLVTEAYLAKQGDTVEADFGEIGSAVLTLS